LVPQKANPEQDSLYNSITLSFTTLGKKGVMDKGNGTKEEGSKMK
jgi:hypothetical protein